LASHFLQLNIKINHHTVFYRYIYHPYILHLQHKEAKRLSKESVSEQRICSYHCQTGSALCHFLTNFPIKQGVFELPTKSVDNFVDTVWATRAFAVESLFALNLPKK